MVAEAERVRLEVLTADGIENLGRVISVLVLLDLTPSQLSVRRTAGGLKVSAVMQASSRDLALCLARLRALVAVRAAECEPAPGG